jgi:hypothetical protein
MCREILIFIKIRYFPRRPISIFFIISLSFLPRMGNVSGKSCRENQNTHLHSITFFENRVVYGVIWKNTVDPCRPQMTIWLLRIACWVTEATNTHSAYVVLIVFFQCYNCCTNALQCYIPVLFIPITMNVPPFRYTL